MKGCEAIAGDDETRVDYDTCDKTWGLDAPAFGRLVTLYLMGELVPLCEDKGWAWVLHGYGGSA